MSILAAHLAALAIMDFAYPLTLGAQALPPSSWPGQGAGRRPRPASRRNFKRNARLPRRNGRN